MSTPARNVVVFGVVLIVGLGAYWVGQQQGEANALSAKIEGVTVPPDMGRLQEENARLVAENDRLAKQGAALEVSSTAPAPGDAAANAAAGPSSLDRLHTLAELQQKKLANVMVTAVDRNGKMPDSFAELFDLSPAERNTLQQAVDQARQQIEQVTVANASVSRRDDGSVVISVPPSEAGNAIRDGLMNSFAQTLGPERNEAFLALNQTSQPGQLANALNGFGAEERTVTVSRRAAPNGNGSAIGVQDMHKNPTGGSSSFGTSVPDVSRLPDNLRWITPLLPADF